MAVSTQVMDFFMDAPTFLEFQKRKTNNKKNNKKNNTNARLVYKQDPGRVENGISLIIQMYSHWVQCVKAMCPSHPGQIERTFRWSKTPHSTLSFSLSYMMVTNDIVSSCFTRR